MLAFPTAVAVLLVGVAIAAVKVTSLLSWTRGLRRLIPVRRWCWASPDAQEPLARMLLLAGFDALRVCSDVQRRLDRAPLYTPWACRALRTQPRGSDGNRLRVPNRPRSPRRARPGHTRPLHWRTSRDQPTTRLPRRRAGAAGGRAARSGRVGAAWLARAAAPSRPRARSPRPPAGARLPARPRRGRQTRSRAAAARRRGGNPGRARSPGSRRAAAGWSPSSVATTPRFCIVGDRQFTQAIHPDEAVLEANEVTTGTLANVLANAMTKRVVQDYQAQPKGSTGIRSDARPSLLGGRP
jgi:hypothetical protein